MFCFGLLFYVKCSFDVIVNTCLVLKGCSGSDHSTWNPGLGNAKLEVFGFNGTSSNFPVPFLESHIHGALSLVSLSFAQSAAPHLSHLRASSMFISSFWWWKCSWVYFQNYISKSPSIQGITWGMTWWEKIITKPNLICLNIDLTTSPRAAHLGFVLVSSHSWKPDIQK